MVNQVCFQVIGCDAAILAGADHGQLELNVMMPMMAWNALHAIKILGNAMGVLDRRCIIGIQADDERCRELLDRSTAIATALSPYIGYAETADIAKTAVKTGRSIRDLVLERKLLDEDQLDSILAVEAMTTPGVPGEKKDIRAGASKDSRGKPRARAGAARRPGDRAAATAAAAARPPVPAAGSRGARGAGSRVVAKTRADHGSPRDRGRKRRR
jgi:hypothetical protein